MKKTIQLLAVSLLFFQHSQAQSSFDEKVTTVSNVGLTLNNVGTFGNAFRGSFDVLGNPSCEYPRNSGIEHLFEAGIWIGAVVDGSFRVSTAAYDNSSGYSTGKAGYELTPEVGAEFLERSSLFNSPYFNSSAISHQDFLADFSDKNQVVPGTNIQINSHQFPMGLQIHFEAYNWNYAFADFFVICNYQIVNTGNSTLDSVHFGFWANEVVRNINITPAGQGGSAFFDKGGNGFVDSLHMAYCFDATGDPGFTESYIAHKFLGGEDKTGFRHPSLDPGFNSNYQAWIFNNSSDPIFFIPGDDNGRYIKMTTGFNQLPCWDEYNSTNPYCGSFQSQTIQDVLKQAGNRSDLVSVGPFASMAPGDTINVAWAFVLAKKYEDGQPNTNNSALQQTNLIRNATWAQTAYNGEDINFNGILDEGEDRDKNGEITRFILPTPPEIPVVKVVPTENQLEIYWADNAEQSLDPISKKYDFEGYRVYATKVGFDVQDNNDILNALKRVSEYDATGNKLFFNTGFGAVRLESDKIFEGDSVVYKYKYVIPNVLNGWQYAVAVTSFDTGDDDNQLESLESSVLANTFRVFPGKPANTDMKANAPFVYPNPYYAGASWEGASTYQEDKKLTFANLPKRCIVRIFTTAGDLVDEFEHDENYNGSDIRWYNTYSDTENTVFSGGEHSWDLLSANSQIIARGVYTFSVEDLDTGKSQRGKFVIIK